MSLPEGFVFSQGSLQAYVDCPRLFQLHYLLNVTWPALDVEPQLEGERQREQGSALHRLLQQHAQGIPEFLLSTLVLDEDVDRWWNNYLEKPPPDVPSELVRAEIGLSVPIAGFRLMARYDRVGADPGRRIVIVDWKTGWKLPLRAWLENRMQTRVYRYVMTLAGSAFNGGVRPEAEQIEMIYWNANHPDRVMRFQYDGEQFEADGVYLHRLIQEIAARDEENWELTNGTTRCPFCHYRSLCKRGRVAGAFDELEDDEQAADDEWDFDLDLEQVAEVIF